MVLVMHFFYFFLWHFQYFISTEGAEHCAYGGLEQEKEKKKNRESVSGHTARRTEQAKGGGRRDVRTFHFYTMYILAIQLSFSPLVSLALAEWYRSLNRPASDAVCRSSDPLTLSQSSILCHLYHALLKLDINGSLRDINTAFAYILYQRQAPRGKKS